jgi:type IV pilus assembly protein PilQ
VVKNSEPLPLPSAKPAPTPVAPPSSSLVASKTKQPVLMASVTPAPALAPQPTVAPAQSAQPAPVQPASVPAVADVQTSAPAPQPAPAASSNAAQQFVMVQPSYNQKTEDPTAKTAAQAQTPAADTGSKFPTQSQIAMASGMTPAPMQAAAAVPPAPPQTSAPRPKYTGEPISVNLKDVDLKDFFRLIHEISGLNIVLDPNVRGSLTLVLDDVPWDQALDIVLKNNGLERELDGNVLRIATVDTLRHEADSRRAQVEAKAMADPKITVTRFLSYAHSKDVVPIVKKFLSQRGEIISDDRTNGLIMQDIPSVFPEIDRVLTQLDRKTPEVEIEARVVAATRSFARDIGTQLGFAFGNAATAVGGSAAVGPSPVGTPGLSGSTSIGPATVPYMLSQATTAIPLFSNFPAVGPTSGLTLSNVGHNYRVDAILTMAESRGLLKILSRPRVVTQNNIQANVRQGVQIPIVTTGMLNGPPTTTYVSAFLRLTVTPQITIENTIFLNVDVENTTPDFSHVSPITGNPTLLTQQATTQVLVTDGGTVVIGGVIQTNNSVTIFQVPVIGNIPALGNLFKRRAVQTQTQELFFFITPKIIQT